ncbi:MAG: hypothetical protein ABFS12_16790 [Bacteroidota bacterium]
MKKVIIPILILALFNYGCYSFYEISSEEISKTEKQNDIKLEMKNKMEILLKEDGNFDIEVKDSLIYFSNETIKDSIKISEIHKIFNKKLSVEKILGLTLNIAFFALFFIPVVVWVATGAESVGG